MGDPDKLLLLIAFALITAGTSCYAISRHARIKILELELKDTYEYKLETIIGLIKARYGKMYTIQAEIVKIKLLPIGLMVFTADDGREDFSVTIAPNSEGEIIAMASRGDYSSPVIISLDSDLTFDVVTRVQLDGLFEVI